RPHRRQEDLLGKQRPGVAQDPDRVASPLIHTSPSAHIRATKFAGGPVTGWRSRAQRCPISPPTTPARGDGDAVAIPRVRRLCRCGVVRDGGGEYGERSEVSPRRL